MQLHLCHAMIFFCVVCSPSFPTTDGDIGAPRILIVRHADVNQEFMASNYVLGTSCIAIFLVVLLWQLVAMKSPLATCCR